MLDKEVKKADLVLLDLGELLHDMVCDEERAPSLGW